MKAIDISNAPSPPLWPMAAFFRLAWDSLILGVLGFGLGIAALWGQLARVLPQLGIPRIAAELGMGEDAFFWSIWLPTTAALGLAVSAFISASHRSWRIPIYNITMGQLTAALDDFRHKLGVGLRGRVLWTIANSIGALVFWSGQIAMSFAMPSAESPYGLRIAMLVLAVFCTLNAIRLAESTRRAAIATRDDLRRPILFLRSFSDDERIAGEDTGDYFSPRERNTRFEEVLDKAARSYGPVIAVGKPGVMPGSGAARAYYKGDDWREAVTAWMNQAVFIIMVAGYSPGLTWELETAIARGHERKIVLVFPPHDPHFEARWNWMQTRFHGHQLGEQLAGADRSTAIAVHADRDGDLVVLKSRNGFGRNYRAALAISLYGKFRDADGQMNSHRAH